MQKVWQFKRFLLILHEHHWKRLERHTLLAKSMKKCDTSSVLADFRWKSLNAWSVTLFLQKALKSVTLQVFLTDFMWKSLILFTTLCIFLCLLAGFERKCGNVAPKWCSQECFLELIPGIRGIPGFPGIPRIRGIPGIPGNGVTKCGSGVSFRARPLVRMAGV